MLSVSRLIVQPTASRTSQNARRRVFCRLHGSHGGQRCHVTLAKWRVLGLKADRHDALRCRGGVRQCVAVSAANDSESLDSSPEKLVGTWQYRNPWHGLVVGEFVISRTVAGDLQVSESPSRNGLTLSGLLQLSDKWFVAQLQHGYSCRLRLEDSDKMASQFCEAGGKWEPVVISGRELEQTPLRMGSILVGSLAASAACSSALFGWHLGVGMILHLLVHELGHAFAMRQLGVPVGPIVFVPFIGAAVKMKSQPTSARHEAIIALAGPYVGSAGALACLSVVATGGYDPKMWMTLTKFGLLINLGNMLPLGILDGGRVAPMFSKWAMPAGLCGSAALFLVEPQPGFATVFGMACAYRIWSPTPSGREALRPDRFYELLTRQDRAAISCAYLGLMGVLFWAHALNEKWFHETFRSGIADATALNPAGCPTEELLPQSEMT